MVSPCRLRDVACGLVLGLVLVLYRHWIRHARSAALVNARWRKVACGMRCACGPGISSERGLVYSKNGAEEFALRQSAVAPHRGSTALPDARRFYHSVGFCSR